MDIIVVFLTIIGIILIAFSAMCVYIIALVAETTSFYWLLIILEKIFHQAVMWR